MSSVVLAWTTDSSIARSARANGLTVTSPSWWFLQPDGRVRDTGSRAYASWARARGLKLWPLFGNRTNQDATHLAVTDPAVRAGVIRSIADFARAYGADGVNVDWENMRVEDRDAFAAFLREASASWRARGLVVSVDVNPQTDDWELGNWSQSFDRAAIGEAADLVVLMAYDEHNRLRPNGPTASLPWVVASLEYLLRSVPADKVVLGVPFYTRDWSDAGMETVTMAATPARLRANNAAQRWEDATGLTYATYQRDGLEHRMWVEDERSLGVKRELVGRYGLAGIAAWRIGFDTPGAWAAISGAASPARAMATARPRTPAPTPAPTPVVTPSPSVLPTVAPTPGAIAAAAARSRRRSPMPWTLGAVAALALAVTATTRGRRPRPR